MAKKEKGQDSEKVDVETEAKEEEKTDSEFSEDKQIFKAKCAECGQEAEVPFKPEAGRDVYCKECYQKRRPKKSFGGGGRSFGGSDSQRTLYSATCAKCGKEAKVPFKPNGKKPILCKECYMKERGSR